MHSYEFPWVFVGQQAVARLLQRGIERGTLAHAYLLYGPAGIGKRDLADAFRASVLCTDGVRRPCEKCKACLLRQRGIHPDMHTIETEDSIGIEQVRALKQSLRLRPSLDGHTVAVLYHAERLTSVAANALLKLLEEPPQGVILVLVADSLIDIPMTIISRCQLIRCKPSPDAMVASALSAQGMAAQLVRESVASAHGRMRYARERALQQDSVSASTIESALRLLEGSMLDRLLSVAAVIAEKGASSEDAASGGAPLSADLINELESLVRDMLLLRAGYGAIAHRAYSERLQRLSGARTLVDIYQLAQSISALRARLSGYAHQQLAWEHFVINA